MTNAESLLKSAINALHSKALNEWEEKFINSIKDYDKKALRNLTTAQYKLLVKCADKE